MIKHFKSLIVFVAKAFDAEGFAFEPKRLEHAAQFRLVSGDILNVYETGTLQWQGRRSDYRAELEAVVAKAHRRWLRRPTQQRLTSSRE